MLLFTDFQCLHAVCQYILYMHVPISAIKLHSGKKKSVCSSNRLDQFSAWRSNNQRILVGVEFKLSREYPIVALACNLNSYKKIKIMY